MMVLCLVKDDAIKAWRNLLGPNEKEKIKEATGTLVYNFLYLVSLFIGNQNN